MVNPNHYVLWGSAGQAKVLAEIIALIGGRVIALFDNNAVRSVLPGVPIYFGEVGFHNWAEKQDEIQYIAGIPSIGGARGRDRLSIQSLFRRAGLIVPVIIHPSAVVSSSACLGSGSQVLALANISAGARLGEACIVNHRASVDHECQLGNGVHLAPGATLCGNVNVSDNVFIGAGAIILPRLSIGADTIIGAGAVVTRDLPDGVTVVGNPAKPLRK